MKKRKTPKEVIRVQCLACTNDQRKEVERCNGDGKILGYQVCPFHPFRLGKGRPSIKIIRNFCLQCMGGSKIFVKECETEDCVLYPFRFGKNPSLARKGKNQNEMVRIRALRRPSVKGNSVYFERSADKASNALGELKRI
jgi:hypothetical protein